MKPYGGDEEYFDTFLTSSLDRNELTASRPGLLYPAGKALLNRNMCEPYSYSGHLAACVILLSLPGIKA
jgi:hypothetical protein